MASRVFLLLCALLVLDATQAKLEVRSDPSTIVANPGDKVTLKCTMQNLKGEVDLKNLLIQWFKRGKQIAEFDNKITIDKPGLSMNLDAIKKGEAALTIESFKAEDKGKYRCYITYGHDNAITEVDLKTIEPTSATEEDLLTTCETVLDKKLDTVINLLGKFDTKLEDLSKGCPPQHGGKN